MQITRLYERLGNRADASESIATRDLADDLPPARGGRLIRSFKQRHTRARRVTDSRMTDINPVRMESLASSTGFRYCRRGPHVGDVLGVAL